MADTKPVDQDALAAEWGLSLEGEAGAAATGAATGAAPGPGAGNDDIAAQWAAMIDEGSGYAQVAKGGAERVLHQDEIDSLLGFNIDDIKLTDNSGIRAIIDSGVVSYERLPMLEIIFDRLVRLTTSSLRQFTSDNVEVSLDRITSVRFGDYLNSIPLPAILTVFRAEPWDNYGLITVDSNLI
jgi:flagellar motor switch protein FliM